jgi:hypothetical protein
MLSVYSGPLGGYSNSLNRRSRSAAQEFREKLQGSLGKTQKGLKNRV